MFKSDIHWHDQPTIWKNWKILSRTRIKEHKSDTVILKTVFENGCIFIQQKDMYALYDQEGNIIIDNGLILPKEYQA